MIALLAVSLALWVGAYIWGVWNNRNKHVVTKLVREYVDGEDRIEIKGVEPKQSWAMANDLALKLWEADARP